MINKPERGIVKVITKVKFGKEKKVHPQRKKITYTVEVPIRPDRRRVYERVRDAFILQANLGCRHSDLIRIHKSNFDRNVFKILQQKTGNHAIVDIQKLSIDPKATYAILEKYNYACPYTADISNYNKKIHEILKLIGQEFAEDVRGEVKINGRITLDIEPKYKRVGSHTARRTFVTCNILRGVSEHQIRKGSGHRSLSSFEKYICDRDE